MQRAALDAAIEKKKAFNDGKAQLLLQGPCLIPVGTYYRSLSPSQRRATQALCGGEPISKGEARTLGLE